jgi:AcrR family transcriptional regulator
MADMGRRPQPEIRERLLDACTSYALECGLPDRMGPLAAAAGTSTRMLVYHFGSRDLLLREVLRRARQRQLEAFGRMLRPRPDEPYVDTLARAWEQITGPEGRPYLRMFNQLHIAQLRDSAGRPLWPGFRRIATTDWLGPLEEGLASLHRPELATLVLATLRGLLMDLDATGDAARTARAWRDLLDAIGS